MSVRIHKENAGLVADQNAYLTRDGRVVGEDDPEANSLLALKGRPISEKLAHRYKIRASRVEEKHEEKASGEKHEEKPKR